MRGSFQATGVKHVKLEGEIKEIGDYAFIHCDELETVEVTTEEGVMTKIGKGGDDLRGVKRRAGNATITVVMSLHEDSMGSEATGIRNSLN